MGKTIGIYVHIPFCMSKCSYCSFISKCASEDEISEYFQMLQAQIIGQSSKFTDKIISSIYIGGGTPSYVDEVYIEKVVKALKEYYNFCNNVEITIECNPCSTTLKKLKKYKELGINRVSFGVQSLNDDCLRIIQRKHNASMALNAIQMAFQAGISNVSCDLLIGIPNQTKNMLLNDISTLVNAGVKHISAYMLMLEEGTKLYEQTIINKTYKVADDDKCVDMYNNAFSLLKSYGFKRYEVSNFALDSYECKHNINYWDMGEYVGFGVSAHSYINGVRIAGFDNFEDYYNYVRNNYILRGICSEHIEQKQEVLTNEQKIEELIMLGLRQSKGVNLKELAKLGYNLLKEKNDIIKVLKEHNIIDYNEDYLYITPDNFGASNQVILELLKD